MRQLLLRVVWNPEVGVAEETKGSESPVGLVLLMAFWVTPLIKSTCFVLSAIEGGGGKAETDVEE